MKFSFAFRVAGQSVVSNVDILAKRMIGTKAKSEKYAFLVLSIGIMTKNDQEIKIKKIMMILFSLYLIY